MTDGNLPGRIAALDGARGVAVFAVVLLHTGLFPYGWIGVDLFFVLSGFLITGILLDAKARGGGSWSTYGRPFYMRRALRIVPLAFACLALMFFVAPHFVAGTEVAFSEQLWYWTYLSNWWVWPKSHGAWYLSHFWSLAVEEQFYLCWPWLVLAVSLRGLKRFCVLLLIGAPILRMVMHLYAPLPPGDTYQILTPLRMDGLLCGSLLAAVVRSEANPQRLVPRINATVCISLLALVLLKVLELPKSVEYVGRFSVVAAFFAAFVGALILGKESVVHKVLTVRPLRWIGTVSYGIYVIHYPISKYLRGNGATAYENFLLTTALTLVLAALSWYAFEKPILSLKHRWPMGGGSQSKTT